MKRDRRLKAFAREMRQAPTPAEKRIWSWLRNRRFGDYKFRRQVPIGPFIVDFYCAELQLAIELDGQNHVTPFMSEYDDGRALELLARGIYVVRIANEVVITDPLMAAEQIKWTISERLPPPPHPPSAPSPPCGGEGY